MFVNAKPGFCGKWRILGNNYNKTVFESGCLIATDAIHPDASYIRSG